MDLYEYQARELFRKHGVPVLDFELAPTPEQARDAAERLIGAGAVGLAPAAAAGW